MKQINQQQKYCFSKKNALSIKNSTTSQKTRELPLTKLVIPNAKSSNELDLLFSSSSLSSFMVLSCVDATALSKTIIVNKYNREQKPQFRSHFYGEV